MPLAPVNIGSPQQGGITLDTGWEADINDFNMDILTCSLSGTLADIAQKAPRKYSACKIPGLEPYWGMSCSDRKIVGGEGKTAKCNLTFKGYVGGTGQARNPIVSLAWTTTTTQVTETLEGGQVTVTIIVPQQAQITLKKGVSIKATSQVGQSGTPFGNFTVPNLMTIITHFSDTVFSTVLVRATTTNFTCTADNYEEAGALWENTQIWIRSYIPLVP